MKREIKHLVVHCTATPAMTTIQSIQRYWREKLGWKNPGYHYIIKRSGEVVCLFGEEFIANGVKGFNKNSIHIAYIGGVNEKGIAFDNRTTAQIESLFNMLMYLSEKYPSASICGHRDFAGVTKLCPSFDVKTWLSEYRPTLDLAA